MLPEHFSWQKIHFSLNVIQIKKTRGNRIATEVRKMNNTTRKVHFSKVAIYSEK